jgi:hypothetical protein
MSVTQHRRATPSLSHAAEPVSIPRHTWELSQIESHHLRQLVGVVLINCQLAQRGTIANAAAVEHSLHAIIAQQATQREAFRTLFGSTMDHPAPPCKSPLAAAAHQFRPTPD